MRIANAPIQTIPADRPAVLSEYRSIIKRRLSLPGDLQRLADLSALLARHDADVVNDARAIGGMELVPFYGRKVVK